VPGVPIAAAERTTDAARIRAHRDRPLAELTADVPGLQVNG